MKQTLTGGSLYFPEINLLDIKSASKVFSSMAGMSLQVSLNNYHAESFSLWITITVSATSAQISTSAYPRFS